MLAARRKLRLGASRDRVDNSNHLPAFKGTEKSPIFFPLYSDLQLPLMDLCSLNLMDLRGTHDVPLRTRTTILRSNDLSLSQQDTVDSI